jgi:hypothetical protein
MGQYMAGLDSSSKTVLERQLNHACLMTVLLKRLQEKCFRSPLHSIISPQQDEYDKMVCNDRLYASGKKSECLCAMIDPAGRF